MKKIFLINFLLAISTAMGMTLLPIIVTESLGVSLFILGIIEGSTEFCSNILRLINGNLFDRLKNKRLLFITSVGTAFFSKLLLLLCLNKYSILASKMIERVANGAFASPRDAYITTNAQRKGVALGILSCSKTLGCVIGTFIISLSTYYWGEIKSNIFPLLLITCVVTFCGVVISYFIKNVVEVKKETFDFKTLKKSIHKLIPIYVISFMFFLARFNDSILMMFLKDEGFPEWFYLSTISFFNISMLIASPILGFLIDQKHKKLVLFITIISLVVFNMLFYNINLSRWLFAYLGLFFWGIQRTGAQIVFSYLVTQKVTKNLNGTSLGILATVTSFGNLISASVSGYLAQDSFFTVFLGTGLIASLALILATFFSRKL